MRLKINFSDGSREYKGSFGEIQPTISRTGARTTPKTRDTYRIGRITIPV